MEEIIEYIKRHRPENGKWSNDELQKLVTWCREKGVTVMALEELLKFYSAPHTADSSVTEEAFVSPGEVFKTSNDVLRQEISKLKYDNDNLANENSKLKGEAARTATLSKVLWGIIVVLLVAIIAVLIFD